MFSWEYCEIFKNTYFDKHLWIAVSIFSENAVHITTPPPLPPQSVQETPSEHKNLPFLK